MNPGRGGASASEHEAVECPACWGQATSLPLTLCRWQDRNKACSAAGQSPGRLASRVENALRGTRRLPQTSGHKDGARVRGSAGPHGIQNSQPQGGERPHRDRMTFPLLAFALIGGQSPRLAPGRSPREQRERILQRLQAGRAPTCLRSRHHPISLTTAEAVSGEPVEKSRSFGNLGMRTSCYGQVLASRNTAEASKAVFVATSLDVYGCPCSSHQVIASTNNPATRSSTKGSEHGWAR